MNYDPDLYYYAITKNNITLYYSYVTNTQVSKSTIPINIIFLIQPKNAKLVKYEKIAELINNRNKLQSKISELGPKLLLYNNKLCTCDETIIKNTAIEFQDKVNSNTSKPP